MPDEIADVDLTKNDLPAPNADWNIIGWFALLFNGYEYDYKPVPYTLII